MTSRYAIAPLRTNRGTEFEVAQTHKRDGTAGFRRICVCDDRVEAVEVADALEEADRSRRTRLMMPATQPADPYELKQAFDRGWYYGALFVSAAAVTATAGGLYFFSGTFLP